MVGLSDLKKSCLALIDMMTTLDNTIKATFTFDIDNKKLQQKHSHFSQPIHICMAQ